MNSKFFLSVAIIAFTIFSEIRYTADFSSQKIDNFTGANFNEEPGEPKLPFVVFSFLLPADISVGSVSAVMANQQYALISGNIDIMPAEPEVVGSDEFFNPQKRISNGRDVAIYEANEYFPQTNIRSLKVEKLRQFKIAKLRVYPFQYNPVTKSIQKLTQGDIVISYDTEQNSNSQNIETPHIYLEKLESRVLNYDDQITTYSPKISRSAVNYTIITTTAIENGLNKLSLFKEYKAARGFNVEVVTEEEWGGGYGNSSAENLRAWLVDNYLQNQISYLLIIGDPNPSNGDIAMKNAYAYYAGKIAHTDYYYSELTGNWDADGDGKYGETDDVKASGGIDAEADIAVGRIPCYSGNYAVVDAILQKCIDYESEEAQDIGWRTNMLLAMDGYYGSEGPTVGEAIKETVEAQSSDWGFYRIYCRYVNSPDEGSCSPQAVTNAWKSNPYGIVSWLTHGNATAAANIMSTAHVPQLSNDNPSFVMMGSCLNGKPDVEDNLAFSILQRGGIGVISGSETTIYKQPMGTLDGSSYNHGMIYNFTENLALDGLYVIDAFDKTRHDADMGCWKNYCCFNLYGDPTLGLDVYGVDVQTAKNNDIVEKSTKVGIVNNKNILTFKNFGKSARISLFNISGQKLFAKTITPNAANVDLKQLNIGNGIILCKINSKNGIQVKHLTLTKQ